MQLGPCLLIWPGWNGVISPEPPIRFACLGMCELDPFQSLLAAPARMRLARDQRLGFLYILLIPWRS